MTEQRGQARQTRVLKVRFLWGGQSYEGVTTDVSASGGFLHTEQMPPIGARVEVILRVKREG